MWQILIKLNLKSEKIDSYLPPIPLEKQQITKLKKKKQNKKNKNKKKQQLLKQHYKTTWTYLVLTSSLIAINARQTPGTEKCRV